MNGIVKVPLMALFVYLALSVSTVAVLDRCCVAPQLLLEDRHTLWRLRPGFHGHPSIFPSVFGGLVKAAPVRIDEHGFRALGIEGRESDPRRATILTVGDSFTFGWDVVDEDTYPAQLQALLDREAPGAFDVINGGVPGYTSFQAKHALRRWIPDLRPRTVLVFVGRNDGWRSFASDATSQRWLWWKPQALNYVFPFMLVHDRGLRQLAEWAGAARRPRVSVEEFRANVEQIIDLASANGVEVILMEHWTHGSGFRVNAMAAARSVAYVATPQLLAGEASKGRPLFLARHFHPNRDGYAVIARALADLILKRGTHQTHSEPQHGGDARSRYAFSPEKLSRMLTICSTSRRTIPAHQPCKSSSSGRRRRSATVVSGTRAFRMSSDAAARRSFEVTSGWFPTGGPSRLSNRLLIIA